MKHIKTRHRVNPQIIFIITAIIFIKGTPIMAGEKKSETRPKAPYKLLYNNDTTNTAGPESPFHKKGEPFTEAKLVASIVEVAGKGVDAYMLSPGMGWVPWWQSKVEPDFYEWWKKRTGLKVVGDRDGTGYEAYVYNGGDMVQVLIDTCRKHKLAPFVSLRLNDVHMQEYYVAKNQRSLVSSRFYVEHPEWHLDPKHPETKPHGYYRKRGMDWAVARVREEKLKLLRELAENYDLAGLELDFLRDSTFFRDNGPPTDKRIEIMTAFVAKVRKALDKKEGKRRWLCVRIPARLTNHPELGLDVKKLHEAGVDMFNLSGWYPAIQHMDTVEVRKRVPDTAVYEEMTFCAGRAINNPRIRICMSDQQFYTTARLAYERGAHGLSLFNFVYYRQSRNFIADHREPPFHVLPKLTDRKFLADQPPYYWAGTGRYWKQLPRTLGRKSARTFQLAMLADDKDARLRLRVHTKEIIGDRKLAAEINGKSLKLIADVSPFYNNPFDTMISPNAKHRRAWEVPGSSIRNGINNIKLILKSGKPITITWVEAGK